MLGCWCVSKQYRLLLHFEDILNGNLTFSFFSAASFLKEESRKKLFDLIILIPVYLSFCAPVEKMSVGNSNSAPWCPSPAKPLLSSNRMLLCSGWMKKKSQEMKPRVSKGKKYKGKSKGQWSGWCIREEKISETSRSSENKKWTLGDREGGEGCLCAWLKRKTRLVPRG